MLKYLQRIKVGFKSIRNKFKKVLTVIKKILIFVLSPIVLGAVYYLFSYLFLAPNVSIKLHRNIFENDSAVGYVVEIYNGTNSDVNNLQFSLRFVDSLSLISYSYENVYSSTNLILRSKEDIKIREYNTNRKIDPRLIMMNGLRGYANQLLSGAKVSIELIFEKVNTKVRGEPFPSLLEPTLFPATYFISFHYFPIGFLSILPIRIQDCFNFNGEEINAGNYRSYTQYLPVNSGGNIPFSLEFKKHNSNLK